MTDVPPPGQPSSAAHGPGLDAAQRWQQVRELLLGDHERGVQQAFSDVAQRFDQEGQHRLIMIEALQKSHQEMTHALNRESRARRELENQVHELRKSHLSKGQLASWLRSFADELSSGED
ncbi:MAG: hypothetical protein GY930_17020 [bacterium]|nr:hypothetical protein [bacterium]